VWVTGKVGEEFEESCLVPKFKKLEAIRVWACFVGGGKGRLIIWDEAAWSTSAKKEVTHGRIPCSLCVRRSARIERKLTPWVYGLLRDACGQGPMPPGRTRRNQALRRYRRRKGAPDAT